MRRRLLAAVTSAHLKVRGAALSLAGAGVAAVLLASCSNGGTSLAQEACTHVTRSITLYTRSEHTSDSATAHRLQAEAVEQLEAAEPLAAQATSADPAFNPLMTTLQESGRTSEGNLVSALEAQCTAAEHPTQQGAGNGTPTRPTSSTARLPTTGAPGHGNGG